MLPVLQEFVENFPKFLTQVSNNWAERFVKDNLIPRLPEGIAEHFPTSLGIVLVMLACCGIFIAIFPLIPLILVLAERKVSAHIQHRTGPMRVGPWGTLQTLADGVKLLFKEDFIPPYGDKVLFILAPYLIFAFSFAVFAGIPFGENLLVSNLNIGIFYIIAISSVVVMGVIMAGWASNNKWSLLGSLRSAAQMVSYEIPVGLSILAVVMLVQSLEMQKIVGEQAKYGIASWLIFRSPFTFITFFIFFISVIAEVNRTPFDLPEAESEIVAGFHTEYSGMRFAFFYIAEYANMFAVSAIASTLFLGGWIGILPESILPQFGFPGGGILSFIIKVFTLSGTVGLIIKTFFLVFVMMWIRWTLPRLRVDQLMNLCWKYFIPISFFNILGTGIWVLIFDNIPADIGIVVSIALIALGLITAYILVGKGMSENPQSQASSA